jgi:NTP pyrophosphatase (non-canonical NTP hydrolase)
MKGEITIRYLQKYLREKDNAASKEHYYIKLGEDMGELARAMLREPAPATPEALKGTVEEELWDVLYYTLILANKYDIDLETWIPLKEKINREKFDHTVLFDPTQDN